MTMSTLLRGWRRVTATVAGIGLAVSVSACGGGGASADNSGPLAGIRLVHKGYLTVALIDGNLPSIAAGPNGTLIGADGAWVQQTADDLGLKIKTFPTTLSGQILAVQQGKADMGTSTHYTPERAKQIYYTFPWSISHTGFITRKGFAYNGPDSLEGKLVGTETGLDYVPYMQKTYGQDSVKLYGGVAQMNNALDNGQIVAEVSGYQSFLTYKAKYPNFEWHALKAGELGMPKEIIDVTSHNFVKCDNKALANALNKTLTKMQNDGSRKKALLKYGDTADASSPPALKSPKELCHA